MLLLSMALNPALACEDPAVFETDPMLTDVPTPDALGPVEVIYGRGPRPDDASCADDHSWMELSVDLPSDVGLKVETEATQSAGAPELGALQGGVYAADEPIVLYWPETESEAGQVLHYTLWLTPVSASGEEGPVSEWEGYAEPRVDADSTDPIEPTSLCAVAPHTSVLSWWAMRR